MKKTRADKPIVDKTYRLEKFEGKGGWTYIRLDAVNRDRNRPFGWVKVQGTIDGFVIEKYNLMPVKGGGLFLPIRAEIRKAIKKQAGDTVHVKLYPDDSAVEIPDELMDCLQDEPIALKFFNNLSDGEKRLYILWIYGAKKEETKVRRMAEAIDKMATGLKMYDKASREE